QDPSTVLERAKIAEETGDVAKAEALLRDAATSKDPAVATLARDRLASLLVRLGRRDAAAPSADARRAQSAPADSPIGWRVSEAVERLDQAPEAVDRAKNELIWIGEPGLPLFSRWIDDQSTSARVRDTLLEIAAQIGGETSLELLERMAASTDDLS